MEINIFVKSVVRKKFRETTYSNLNRFKNHIQHAN